MPHIRHLIAISVALPSLLGACVLEDDQDSSVVSSEITNAPATGDEPSTVFISLPSGEGCSGSVLTAHWILTAAHCTTGQTQGGTVQVARGLQWDDNVVYQGAAHFYAHPDYGDVNNGDFEDDIGLIRLTGTGVVGLTEQMNLYNGAIGAGDEVTVVGYGRGTDPGESQWCGDAPADNIKRIQTFTLETVENELLRFPWGSSKTCSGDSGGPWLVPHVSHKLAAGVHSGSRDGWYNDDNASRTSAKRSWIQQTLATSTTPAECAFFAQTDETNVNFYGCYETQQEVRPNQLSAGRTHACAVLHDGRARCWGDGSSGQLGDGFNVDRSMPVTPIWSAGGTALTRITAGWYHTCAASNANQVSCWGSNTSGQLGNPTLAAAIYTEGMPVQFANGSALTDVRAIAAGGMHSCALTWAGRVYCWGANSRGQLGNDTTTASTQPTLVGHYQELENDPGFRTATTTAFPRPFVPLENVIAIEAGYRHTCAIKSDYTAWCWGDNTYGQLGNGTTTQSNQPARVSSLTNVFRISAGGMHTCATYGSDGSQAACWGWNAFGQLATGSTTGATTPRAVSTGLGTALEVSAGYLHTCFTGSSKNQKCAGYNESGELGNNSTATSTTLVTTLSVGGNARAPAAGSEFTCTFTHTGNVACVGRNADGQLGQNNTKDLRWPYNVLHLHHLRFAP